MVIEENESFEILKGGGIPLILSIDSDKDNRKITLIASEPDTSYAAISHIWSDGLGNVHRSALPRCQMLRLSGLIRSLPGNTKDIILFWIDTIGCPSGAGVQKEAKQLAISKMRHTYQMASAVLALDSWLQYQNPACLSNPEILLRIVCSP